MSIEKTSIETNCVVCGDQVFLPEDEDTCIDCAEDEVYPESFQGMTWGEAVGFDEGPEFWLDGLEERM